MKRKFLLAFLFIISCGTCARSQEDDSLKMMRDPVQRFNALQTYLESINTTRANNVDWPSCIELLKIAQQEKNDSMLAISYNWIGSYFAFTKGDNTSALESFFKAIPLAEKAKDRRRISSLYFDIAVAYFDLNNYAEAFKNNIKGGQNLPDKTAPLYDYMLVQYQRNACIYYLAKKQVDSALHYAALMNETARKVNRSIFTFCALFLNGAAYAQSNDSEMADLNFKRANDMSGSIKLHSLKKSFYLHYINYLLAHNRIEEAKNISQQSFQLAKASDNNILKLMAAGFMRQVYDSLHQTDSAYFYSSMQIATSALIFNQDNNNRIQALAFNEQIRNIEEQAKEREEQEERKQNIQYVMIALGIILFITLFLLLSRTIIVNEKWISFFAILGLLIVFEFINLLIHPYLASFTNHSPILMLAVLVVIAALLIPLHHRLEKRIREQMVEKNKKIRLAAARKMIEKLEPQTKS
jgi:tetratricopeptide (TPR) repeat protein